MRDVYFYVFLHVLFTVPQHTPIQACKYMCVPYLGASRAQTHTWSHLNFSKRCQNENISMIIFCSFFFMFFSCHRNLMISHIEHVHMCMHVYASAL